MCLTLNPVFFRIVDSAASPGLGAGTRRAREPGRHEQALPGVSNLPPAGRTQPRMAVNAAQHKTVNLLKTL